MQYSRDIGSGVVYGAIRYMVPQFETMLAEKGIPAPVITSLYGVATVMIVDQFMYGGFSDWTSLLVRGAAIGFGAGTGMNVLPFTNSDTNEVVGGILGALASSYFGY